MARTDRRQCPPQRRSFKRQNATMVQLTQPMIRAEPAMEKGRGGPTIHSGGDRSSASVSGRSGRSCQPQRGRAHSFPSRSRRSCRANNPAAGKPSTSRLWACPRRTPFRTSSPRVAQMEVVVPVEDPYGLDLDIFLAPGNREPGPRGPVPFRCPSRFPVLVPVRAFAEQKEAERTDAACRNRRQRHALRAGLADPARPSGVFRPAAGPHATIGIEADQLHLLRFRSGRVDPRDAGPFSVPRTSPRSFARRH